jgi:hypothetical protein
MPPRLARHLLGACVLLLPLVAACGGDDDAAPASTGTPRALSTNDSTTSPTLAMPVSRFAISQDDLGIDFLVDIPATFNVTAEEYAKGSSFASAADGMAHLKQWGYLGGYETGYTPEGREKAVLNGAYYSKVETHLFKDEEGAKKAFAYFEARVKGTAGNQPVTALPVGNQWATYQRLSGKVPNSSVNAAYHQYLFRRGNLVAAVLTYGAEGFMKADIARELATLIDQKALGKANAVEPTPVSNYTPPATQKK